MGTWGNTGPSAPPAKPEWLERQEEEGIPQKGTNGRWYILEQGGKVIAGPMTESQARAYFGDYEGPTCSICDGLGHGYPGGGPCPLEDRGAYEPEERW